MSYGLALALTLAIEVPLVLWLSRPRSGAPPVEPASVRALIALAANLLTHGLLWTLMPLAPGSWGVRVAVGEALVWLTEAAAYAGLRVGTPRQALGWSLFANAITTAVGLAHQALA